MSPRPYQLGKRQAAVDEARGRVLAAARALLAEPSAYTAFTVDAVAKRADVARATVYYQFGSKTGLLEALCDDLAESGRMAELATVFAATDARQALHGFIAAFARFWAADRLVMRRLRALAALDPDVGQVITARNDRNRAGLRVLVGRLVPDAGKARQERLVAVLHTLTMFETFDCLAGPGQDLTAVSSIVVELADSAVSQARKAARITKQESVKLSR